MPFWKKKNTLTLPSGLKLDLDEFAKTGTASLKKDWQKIKAQERQNQQQDIKRTLENLRFWLPKERQKAESIATHLPQKGRTKGELLALGFREMLKNLDENEIVKNVFPKQELRAELDHYQRKIIVDTYQKTLQDEIQTLENEAQTQRNMIQAQNSQHITRIQVLTELTQELTQQEKTIDQQRAEIKTQIEALQHQLERKLETPTIQTHKPDLDRLENMLEALRRLKNVDHR